MNIWEQFRSVFKKAEFSPETASPSLETPNVHAEASPAVQDGFLNYIEVLLAKATPPLTMRRSDDNTVGYVTLHIDGPTPEDPAYDLPVTIQQETCHAPAQHCYGTLHTEMVLPSPKNVEALHETINARTSLKMYQKAGDDESTTVTCFEYPIYMSRRIYEYDYDKVAPSHIEDYMTDFKNEISFILHSCS